jgi:hypothetical protein
MITLRWSLFMVQEVDVDYYNVYRSMIGFSFPKSAIGPASSLTIRVNGGDPQVLNIPQSNTAAYLNSVLVNAHAYEAYDGNSIIIRSAVRSHPGSVRVESNTLGLEERLITEKSESRIVAIHAASDGDGVVETFIDKDGFPEDFYSVSSTDLDGIESLQTPWIKPLQSLGAICVIEGSIVNLQGISVPDAEIIATLHETPKARPLTYITKEPIITRTNPDGRFSLPLLQGALVKLDIPAIGYTQMVTIPCRPYIFLQELLVDEGYTYPLGYRS